MRPGKAGGYSGAAIPDWDCWTGTVSSITLSIRLTVDFSSEDVAILRQIPGYTDFSPAPEDVIDAQGGIWSEGRTASLAKAAPTGFT